MTKEQEYIQKIIENAQGYYEEVAEAAEAGYISDDARRDFRNYTDFAVYEASGRGVSRKNYETLEDRLCEIFAI